MIEKLTEALCEQIKSLPLKLQVSALNHIRRKLHDIGPFSDEPVDLVLWKNCDDIKANDYNPNRVAPPEMQLLKKSVDKDGYTQPIVVYPQHGRYTVVDGFHRMQIGKSSCHIRERIYGFLPITEIRTDACDKTSRMASTIRHNRARGTEKTTLMMNIVGELVSAGMSDTWIMKNIGMDADELLRLKQVSGLAAMFRNQKFSMAWARDRDDATRYR